MTITVAGNKKEYEDGISITNLIKAEDIDNPDYVTITVNDEFIDRENFETTSLKDGDTVEFLYFMGGGAK